MIGTSAMKELNVPKAIGRLRDRLQISPLIINEFKRIS